MTCRVNLTNRPVTLENRSRSLILELGGGVMRLHALDKFELSGLKFCPAISQTKPK